MATIKRVEYMCSYCGIKKISTIGRPQPGICTRKGKTKDGRTKPHTWVRSGRQL